MCGEVLPTLVVFFSGDLADTAEYDGVAGFFAAALYYRSINILDWRMPEG
tara:strand:+ start:881 stop:1030 length:150 start_codon:yes stop_codon:yes gene_type:complete